MIYGVWALVKQERHTQMRDSLSGVVLDVKGSFVLTGTKA